MKGLVEIFENIQTFDRFELKTHLLRFSIEVNEEEETVRLRQLLKKVILEEILKSEISNTNYYSQCLKETVGQLQLVVAENGYRCAYVGCRFLGNRHKDYVRHLRICHPNFKNIECNFKKVCKLKFDGIEDLIQHLKVSHSGGKVVSESSAPIVINLECQCNRLTCRGRAFENVNLLMKHWNTYHSNENRDCIFLNCDTTFSESSVSRHHFRIKHKHTGDMTLKPRHLKTIQAVENEDNIQEVNTSPSVGSVSQETREEFIEDYNDEDFEHIESLETEVGDGESENYYLGYYADFFNRLVNVKFIPVSTVTQIADEYLSNTRKSLEHRQKLLRKSLGSVQGICQADIEKVVKEVFENDMFLNAQMCLNTEYKRNKYIRENMRYVAPEEIVLNEEEVKLGKKKEVIHYVSMSESLKALIEDPTTIKMMAMKTSRQAFDHKISDLKDGSVYSKNGYFRENPDAFSAIVYSDAVELKEPYHRIYLLVVMTIFYKEFWKLV